MEKRITVRQLTRHELLAKRWLQWNGKLGTSRQIESICGQLPYGTLLIMLRLRGISVD